MLVFVIVLFRRNGTAVLMRFLHARLFLALAYRNQSCAGTQNVPPRHLESRRRFFAKQARACIARAGTCKNTACPNTRRVLPTRPGFHACAVHDAP